MSPVISLAKKDLRLLARDPMDLFFTFLFPLFIALLFGAIFHQDSSGSKSKLDIAVVDEDHTAASAAFVHRLETSDEFQVRTRVVDAEEVEHPLTREQATELVRRGTTVASVVIPGGFGAAGDTIFRGEPIRLEGAVDPTHQAEAGMIQGILTKYAFQGMSEMFGDPARMRAMARKNLDDLRASTGVDPAMKSALESFLPSVEKFFTEAPAGATGATAGTGDSKPAGLAGWEPVKIELKQVSGARDGPPSSYAVSFPQAVIWGVLGCVMSFGVSLTSERSSGTLVRLRLAPIARWHILAGKAVACFLTALAVTTSLMLLGYVVFGIVPASPGLLVVAAVVIAIAFVGVMMLLASLAKTVGGASGLGRAVLLVLAMIGGGSIPLFVMPPWLRTASSISPFKWAIDAMDLAIWRARSPAEMLLPCAVLLGIGLGGFAIGAVLFERQTSG